VITTLLHPILGLHGIPAYCVVAAFVFAEASVMFGFIFPGETAALLGGVLASTHHVSLGYMIAVVVLAAIVGDSLGYLIGAKLGPRILRMKILKRRLKMVESAMDFLRRRGALAVFVGRFTAFFRAMVPGLSGMSGMRYRIFLPANVAGGIIWGAGYTLLGFAAASAYTSISRYSGWASDLLALLVVVAIATILVVRRRRERVPMR
jgi:membrane protein DedA with SNARE-associated domain